MRRVTDSVDLHRLTRSDDVVVDERSHVHLLLHPPGSRRRRCREERIGREHTRSGRRPGRVERLDPVIRREGVEGRRTPVEGTARRLDLEHRGLAGRKVDAAVVGPPHGHDGVSRAALTEQVPVLPVERSNGGACTGAREHHGDDHDPEADGGSRDEPTAVAEATDHDRPERREEGQRAHRDRVPGREDRRGPADPSRGNRCREERPAPCRDRDREAERAGGEEHERMQLGVGLRDERRRDGVDVPQSLADDVAHLPHARSHRDERQDEERRHRDGRAHRGLRRQCGRHHERRHADEHARARPRLDRRPRVGDGCHGHGRGEQPAAKAVDEASHSPLPHCGRREPRRSVSRPSRPPPALPGRQHARRRAAACRVPGPRRSPRPG